ncbi:MAG TPA: periplasmic heavy metal sensor [Polyangia bacterium]|nr:periplasmic heavy metal sensor [Polyangia bacterium]
MIPMILGAIGGFAAVRMIRRIRHARGGWGRHGHGGFGRGRFGGRGMFFALRRLGLDRGQREQVWSVVHDVKQSFGELRAGKLRGLDAAVDAVSGPTFDRTRVEAEAAKQGEAFGRARQAIVDGLERIHAILTPEQRERLRSMMGGEPEAQVL